MKVYPKHERYASTRRACLQDVLLQHDDIDRQKSYYLRPWELRCRREFFCFSLFMLEYVKYEMSDAL